MKNTLFIMTHLGSGWEKLSTLLEECPNIHVFQTGNSYGHPDDVLALKSNIHRRKTSASVWADVLFHNKDFKMKKLCKYYSFIFWSCPLDQCLEELIKKHNYSKNTAKDYWEYRNNGLKEYHKRCQGSLWNPKLDREFVLASVLR